MGRFPKNPQIVPQLLGRLVAIRNGPSRTIGRHITLCNRGFSGWASDYGITATIHGFVPLLGTTYQKAVPSGAAFLLGYPAQEIIHRGKQFRLPPDPDVAAGGIDDQFRALHAGGDVAGGGCGLETIILH